MKFVKIFKLIIDHKYRFMYLSSKGKKSNMPADKFLKRFYKIKMGKNLDLDNPKSYTEKLQWLKLFDQRPEYTTMVDKYTAKSYVAERIGEQYIIPTLGVWKDANDIEFDILPDKFVLKTTHNSGGIVICKDKKTLNIKAARKKLNRFLKQNYYYCNREWPYKNVKPLIIAEKYMEDSTFNELRDYKFFTFGGVPKVLYIAQGRGNSEPTVADFFDMDFKHLPFTIDHNMADNVPLKPNCFEEMKKLAAILSAETPQLRVDFYEVDNQVYFGEMTFFHCSGFEGFHPEEWDMIFGDWVTLPTKRTEHCCEDTSK